MDDWDPVSEMELSIEVGEGGYGLLTQGHVGVCNQCGEACIAGHRCRADERLTGRGRAFVATGEEQLVLRALAEAPTGHPAERFIINYRNGYWSEYLARVLVVDEYHLTLSIDFDLLPDREELPGGHNEDEIHALEAARCVREVVHLASSHLTPEERQNLASAVADTLGCTPDDDEDDAWGDADWRDIDT